MITGLSKGGTGSFPDGHKEVRLTWAPLTDGITSSGFPLSNTFLCCYNTSQKRLLHEIVAYVSVVLLTLKNGMKKALTFLFKSF